MDENVESMYILSLKYGWELNVIPKIWYRIEQAKREVNPEHVIKVPDYIKFIVEHGTGFHRKV